MTLAERLVLHADDVTIRPATAAERAFGKKVNKYSPDQPRDDHGRFADTGGGEFAEMPLPTGSQDPPNTLPGFDHRWFDAYAATLMRQALSYPDNPLDHIPLIQTGPFMGLRPQEVEDYRDSAKQIVGMVNAAPPTTEDLYRGIGVKDADYAALRDELAAGKTVDLNLSSWTPSEKIATNFSTNVYSTQDLDLDRPPDHSVVFDLAPGAHALDVHEEAPSFQQFARENLTAGRFAVTGVDHQQDFAPHGADDAWMTTLDTIHLQQIGTLAPEQLLGAKVAQVEGPARLLPWLEPYMDQRMVPPQEARS